MSAHTDMQVEFTLHDFSCSPDAVTRLLGVTPTKIWSEGDRMPPSKIKRKSNGWSLRSSATPTIADLEAHVRWLLSHLPHGLDALKQDCGNWYAEISVVVDLRDGAPVLHLPAELLGRLANIGASIDVDMYVRRAEHTA